MEDTDEFFRRMSQDELLNYIRDNPDWRDEILAKQELARRNRPVRPAWMRRLFWPYVALWLASVAFSIWFLATQLP